MNFIFSESETKNINKEDLINLKKKYWLALNENPFPDPPEKGNAIEMIKYFKRKQKNSTLKIGPYEGITVFEAANRIASDLVIINGILQLINDGKEEENSRFTIYFGNKHVPNNGDFIINGKQGEAFNVASSFYKIKLRTTTKKWINDTLTYILVNAEVFKEIIESENNKEKIIKVINWGEE